MIKKNAMKSNICISTQHPALGGGIANMVDNYTAYLIKNKFRFNLAFSSNPIPNLFFNEDVKNKISHPKLVEKAKVTRTYMPIYHLNFKIYGAMMRKHVQKYDVCHSIGGSCLEAMPFLKANKKFISWMATTFLDEWKSAYRPNNKAKFTSRIIGRINNSNLDKIRRLERKILQKATIINPISSRTRDQIIKEHKIDPEKIRIIPPPINLSKIKKIGKRPEKDYILFVGRLDKRKNIEMMLKAFKSVQKKHTGLNLVIVGDGPESQRLKEYATNLGIADKVKFPGFVSAKTKLKYLSNARIFVLSSTQEGFGIVLVEALALEVPVVSTACGGTEDIVEHGKNGFLVKIGDHKDFASKINMLMDENLRSKMGRYGKRSVQKFSAENVGKKVIKQYGEII